MDIQLAGLRDRRVAAAEETISVAGARIYGRGSSARLRGAQLARGTDRRPDSIRVIVLHQTAGRSFLPSTRAAYPGDAAADRNVGSDHDIDRISAHFVVLSDGTIFYTHDIEYIVNSAGGSE